MSKFTERLLILEIQDDHIGGHEYLGRNCNGEEIEFSSSHEQTDEDLPEIGEVVNVELRPVFCGVLNGSTTFWALTDNFREIPENPNMNSVDIFADL